MPNPAPLALTRRPLLAALAGTLVLGACATAPRQPPSHLVTGTARLEGQVALPPSAQLHVSVADVSRADARATTLAEFTGPAASPGPMPFSLAVERTKVEERGSYSVRGEVLVDGKILYVTDSAYLVLGHSGRTTADLVLRPVDTRAQPPAPRIEGVRWVLVSLDGQPLGPQDPATAPHFTLQPDGRRVTVFGGCNTLQGDYLLNGTALQMLRSQRNELKVCDRDMERERALLFALATTEQWAMEGQRLRLLDRLGTQIGVFVPGR